MMMGVIGSITMAISGPKDVAPAVTVTTNPLHCVQVTDAEGRLVNGCYDVVRFAEQNGSLWAVCKLKGILDGVDIDEDCWVPITVGDCDGDIPPRLTSAGSFNCDCLVIRFGSCGIVNPRLTVTVNPTQQSCTPADYPTQVICSIVTACGNVTNPRIVIASLMNQLL
jgi:hypothetical protein